MKITAVIAEYNPFHNGHQFQINQIKKSPDDMVVAIMSGNFVQRGDVACMNKFNRANAAIQCGVDLVLELPLPYAMNTAERFAFGGISLANALGCIDYIAFGAENADISLLTQTAQLLTEDRLYAVIRQYLASGITFATAREKAVSELGSPYMAELLKSPNNILGIEYIKQLLLTNSKIQPVAINRIGIEHDAIFPQQGFASGSYIRELIQNGSEIQNYIPHESYIQFMQGVKNGNTPVSLVGYDRILLAKLRSLSKLQVEALPDITEGIQFRLLNGIKQADSYSSLLDYIKTKRYTMARVRRLVLSAALGIDGDLCKKNPPYLRILAIGNGGKQILHLAKNTATIPISHSLAKLQRLNKTAEAFTSLEASSTDFYNLLTPTVFPCGLDYQRDISFFP
ncbi:MAG: nucleotidyltransferase family protein [Oscillospiraceae bacterium]